MFKVTNATVPLFVFGMKPLYEIQIYLIQMKTPGSLVSQSWGPKINIDCHRENVKKGLET
jgi:ribulose 1,5-bisphosphate carboxylase large subunit-like protein